MKIERVVEELEARFGEDATYAEILVAITEAPHSTPLADKFSLYMMSRILERNGAIAKVIDDL